MGCDIHGWVEVFHRGKYVAVKPLEDRTRNYRRFAALAGVRGSGKWSDAKPIGIPVDVSDTAKYDIDSWAEDGHSHSHLPLIEAARIFLETDYNPGEYAATYPLSHYFGYEENDTGKARLVFWFDN